MPDCVRFINYLIIIINQFGALSDILPSFSSDRSSSIGMPWYYFLPLTTVFPRNIPMPMGAVLRRYML